MLGNHTLIHRAESTHTHTHTHTYTHTYTHTQNKNTKDNEKIVIIDIINREKLFDRSANHK